MKIIESAALAVGTAMALSMSACSVSGDVNIEVPSVTTTSGATPSEIGASPSDTATTPVDNGNILSYTTCTALASLAMALGGEGYPIVDIDPNSPTLGKTIADEADAANLDVLDSIAVGGEIPADVASMDAFALTRVTDVAVQDMRYFFDGKSLIQVTSKKMQPELEGLEGEANQARAFVKEVSTNYCEDPAYPDPKSPFEQ